MQQRLRTLIEKAETVFKGHEDGLAREDIEALLRALSDYEKEAARRDDELRALLEEAEQTIDAIRRGEVDAIVSSDGGSSTVYTLDGPDRPYQSIVETMNAGAVTIDGSGTIFYSNGAFSEMTGLPLKTLMGSSFRGIVVPDDLPLFSRFLEETRESRKTTEEIRLQGQKTGFFARLAGSSQKIFGMERTCIVITDITDLKLAEGRSRNEAQAAERERDRLMTLIDGMNDGVWFTSTDGTVMLANPAARLQSAELGLDPDSIQGAYWPSLLSGAEMLTLHGKPLKTEYFMASLTGKAIRRMEVAVRNKTTGKVFYRRISANPVFGREKRVEGVITVMEDITAEKAAADEKTHLEEQLRQSQKMEAIGTLAGGIAHDFNNMLAVIMGNAEIALDDADSNEASRQNLERIMMASKRARDLVKQILAFSRKTEQDKGPLRLSPLVKETFKLLRGSLPATIEMRLHIGTELDTVTGDPSQIQQILMNLATNASYAMRGRGGVLTITISNCTFPEGELLPDSEMSPGPYVKLTVADTGRGMAGKVKARIFEPFFTTKSAGQGTGMGLAVVYGIVRSHGGSIIAESRPGKGSTFAVFLPFEGKEARKEDGEGGRAPHGRERLLLVDDEPLVADMTSQTLKHLGYEVTTAAGGVEALKLFSDDPRRFDLVITDQTMPEITGISLAERMLEEREDIPIILVTGYSETVSQEVARAAGIREYVMKPVTKREIAKTIRKVLDSR